jgi:hypothetical protein
VELLLGWFDLGATSPPLGPAGGDSISTLQQLLLYGFVVLGVLLSESVAMARRGGPIRVELSWPWVVVASVIALVVFPAVWRDIGAMAEASPLVQFGVATQGGVFWGVIMAGAEKQALRSERGAADRGAAEPRTAGEQPPRPAGD